MNKHFLRIVAILLVSLMLIPTVFGTTALRLNKVVVVGSIDSSLGYDEIVNGTTTFLVARSRPVSERTFYHNVTKFEWKHSSVEVSPEMLGSYYDNLTGKYCYDTLVAEPYQLAVPDPTGKVTVFSNMVFQDTGWNPKSKTILHPDGTSQSILHVKGQASGDPSARYLVVTIYNSKYPGGYQVDYTVVQSSFDKSYDITNIVAERDLNTISIVVTTYEGKWDIQSYFWVSTIGTDVYIVMIPDVPTSWVSDMEAVRRGVETACMVTPLVHLDTWKGLTYLEISDMPTYEYIIQYPENVKPPGFHGETGIIVVNAHGEVLPVQPGCNWETWVRVIRQHVQRKAVTWVQVAGYPFYYYSKGSHVKTEVGPQGFQLFLEPILGQNTIDCWPNQEGYAVPLQGGYSNRLWGYGLIEGGLHEGRPLKIDSSTNLADLLDVMGYRSGGIEYLTLGLIGFALPNQTIQKPSERVGYYVHNGAQNSDNDFNKGKYSMAVAAWTKISILAVGYSDVYYEDYWGNKYYVGSFTSAVTWSYAVPPASSTAPWTIRFVITTIACMRVIGPFVSLPFGLWAPLKITRTSSTTTFEFISSQSTTLEDASEQSWQNTIAQGFLWTAISVILIPITLGWSVSAQMSIAVALGFASTVTAVAYQSPSPVTSGSYIDLALDDYSAVGVKDEEENGYFQLQSYAVTETYLTQSANGGASETLTFTSGQKAWYVNTRLEEFYAEETLSFSVPTIVEPYTSADVNHASETPSTPSGPTSGSRGYSYSYYTTTTDPDGDDVRYQFDWDDGSTTTTGWYSSGSMAWASHTWGSTGTYHIKVRAQDSYGDWSDWSSSYTVSIRSGGGGSEPCPTLFVWNGSAYVDYGVINIHDPSGKDIIQEVPVLAEDVDINNYKAKFRLQEGWPGLEFSESDIDQVKLYTVDNEGNRRLCPLIEAVHDEQGNVLPQLLKSDDYKIKITLLEIIDLTFVVPYQNIQSFTFVIEGNNMYKP